LGALRRVVDHTIESKADFLVVAGDIYDSKDRNLRALVSFRHEMERLAERQVPVFLVHGNHDPLNGWGSGFQLPPNVVTFGGEADTEPFIRRGRQVAQITGISYVRERVTDNLASSLKPAEDAPYSIAVLHANVGHQSGHADYAPAAVAELTAAGFDYWALGHVHTRSVLAAEPAMIVYPGNTQGRNPREMRIGLNLIRISAQAERDWQNLMLESGEELALRATERAVKVGTAAAQSPTHVSKRRRRARTPP
jgi:DNA repair exonuclease SbcCD nuclease subunit